MVMGVTTPALFGGCLNVRGGNLLPRLRRVLLLVKEETFVNV